MERRALEAAVKGFVDAFVVPDKRTQIRTRLLTGERRDETLTTLPRWLVQATPLAGADRSPAGITKRFGELSGVHLDGDDARRTTIANALALGRKRASVFVADSGALAVVTAADGTALLCSRFAVRP